MRTPSVRSSTSFFALVLATALLALARPAGAADASIALSRTVGPPTTGLAVRGSGFGASEVVQLTFDTHPLARTGTTPAGTFQLRVRVPKAALPGEHTITATGRSSGLVATAPFTVRTDWPMFHFSLNRSGSNPYENVLSPETVTGLELKWAAPILATADSPAVVGGVLYTGDLVGNLYAFDAATGTQLWKVTLGNQGLSDPAVAGGVVYVGTCINGTVVAVDAATGTKLWTKVTGGGVFGSPVVANGRVYVGTNADRLYALDAATGAEVWSASYDGAPDSPAVAGGMVYVGSYDAKMYAFDAATGEQRWVTPVDRLADATPAVVGGVLYVGTANGDHTMYAMDAATGAVLWSRELGGAGSELYSSPAVAGERVYVGSLDGSVYALEAATGALIWSRGTGALVGSSPALANGVVYVGSDDDAIYALDAVTGMVIWTYKTGGYLLSSPAVADGVVYVGSYDANLYAFSLPG